MTPKKRDPEPFDPAAYDRADPYRRNRLLFDWLGDDRQRRAFYAAHAGRPLFTFPSRAEDPPDPGAPSRAQPPEPQAPLTAHLVLDRALIDEVLADDGSRFSNLPYAQIGSGSFMLALDPAATPMHGLQREAARRVFGVQELDALCRHAVRQAGTLALQGDAFDLAHFAEQAALRFCSLYFGFALKDFVLLENSMRAAYAALAYTNLGRHFASEPLTLPLATQEMGRLAQRCAELIDAYALWPAGDWPEPGMAPPGMPGYVPVMRRLAQECGGQLSGSQMAVLVVGTLAGTVGNIQAATCIAVDALLRGAGPGELPEAALMPRCWQAWRERPPVPFLARRVLQADRRWADLGVAPGHELVLAIGAGTQGPPPHSGHFDPLVFATGATHDCLGRHLALPLVETLVRQVLALPDLARAIDPLEGTPMPLEQRWGFQCTALPLTHRRRTLRIQQPLNVSMRVKPPIAINAAKLRETIRAAAPRISEALQASGMVHFAWFEFTDLDSQLVLHTVYDGDFDAYVEHFALAVGDLFDELFQYIQPAPPQPISRHPFEFIELIRRYNRAPVGNYFYSAYPTLETLQVQRTQRPQQKERP